jgi:hypothetical protein
MSFTKSFGRGGAAALALAGAALIAQPALAADHRDGQAVQADENGDITDVYAWMNGTNAVLAMNVHRDAGIGATFSDAIQYAFHVGRHTTFPLGAVSTTDVICEFDEAQMIQCWVGDEGYVTGDAGAAEGITNASDDIRVFAGPRQDPFFFYVTGLINARQAVVAAVPDLVAGDAIAPSGCPELDDTTSQALLDVLRADGQALNDFDEENVLSIVIELDAAYLADSEAPVFSVWGSTHLKPE